MWKDGEPDDGDDVPFEQRLAEARRELDDALTSREPVTPRAETPLGRGEGEAAEGRVRAVAVSGGRLESLELDPRVLRLPPGEIGVFIAAAVNAALTEVRGKVTSDPADSPPDPATLLRRLGEAQNEGLRQLGVMMRGLNEALAGIQDRAHVGDPAPLPDVEGLVGQVGRLAGPAAPGGGHTPAAGTAADGEVRVTVSGGGLVETVELTERVVRQGSHALAAHVVTAGNAALAEARANAADATAALGPQEMAEQVRRIQDQSLEQFFSFTRSLTSLMNSVEKRS
ncbi:YbaB/EbfC family nucleoid-associated protein [Actinomadura kijaniata]|uniref:YbaB/EbfC family nucleoid-associated protein n=1 Tax=Actinomadura kijaniata TaxID=46161 RepID=UPI003F1B0E9D